MKNETNLKRIYRKTQKQVQRKIPDTFVWILITVGDAAITLPRHPSHRRL